ncbi:MAG: CpsB/CapC family capsule biosynthesis tyrosine phosphatase [Bryobacterales bacterium]|nr:CpsB/CapC family capsule biosynthesis tyrosine phosphatase [Bryobacterales bacterium]
MIDIHSHILYGLDDGAGDRETSLAMLRMAAETGTTDIVATPHSDLAFAFQPELAAERLAELREASGGVPRLHTGCDFHLHYENVQDALAHPARYTINHQSYLLVEFSDLVVFNNSGQILGALLAAGMRPIITHPERNSLLQQRLPLLAEWVGGGCSLQVTAQSLLGEFGRAAKDTSEELMKRGLVHFIASDAHDCEHRPPRLDLAYAHVARRWGPQTADRLLVHNPAAALVGDPLPAPPAAPPEPSPRKWYRFWR